MQIVIKLSEKDYKSLNRYINFNLEYEDGRILSAVKQGVVLPENHGRLIDADVFEKRLMNARSYYLGEKADDFDLRFAAGLKSAVERLVDEATIIE